MFAFQKDASMRVLPFGLCLLLAVPVLSGCARVRLWRGGDSCATVEGCARRLEDEAALGAVPSPAFLSALTAAAERRFESDRGATGVAL